MNNILKKLIAMHLCSIMLLALSIPVSAQDRTPAPADNRGDTASAPHLLSALPAMAHSGSLLTPANNMRNTISKGLTKELVSAWRNSADGTSSREAVLLIFRMRDGSYIGKSQGFTNEYQKFTFKWNPAAVAIVHTHPNRTDPRPAEQDRRVADRFGVPNFTITITGMYVYDPVSRKTSKVLNGLEWLNLSANAESVTRWLGA